MRAPKGECILTLNDLLKWQEGLLLVVMPPHPGKHAVEISTPQKTWNRDLPSVKREQADIRFETTLRDSPKDILALLKQLTTIAQERVWLGAYRPHRGNARRRLASWKAIAEAANVPLIATNDVLYHAPERRALADVVACIREHVTLDGAGRVLEVNAERHLKSPAEMTRLFHDCPSHHRNGPLRDRINFARSVAIQLPRRAGAAGQDAQPISKISPGRAQGYAIRASFRTGSRHAEKELVLIERLRIALFPDRSRHRSGRQRRFSARAAAQRQFFRLLRAWHYRGRPMRSIFCSNASSRNGSRPTSCSFGTGEKSGHLTGDGQTAPR
jgi:hypothetical protein